IFTFAFPLLAAAPVGSSLALLLILALTSLLPRQFIWDIVVIIPFLFVCYLHLAVAIHAYTVLRKMLINHTILLQRKENQKLLKTKMATHRAIQHHTATRAAALAAQMAVMNATAGGAVAAGGSVGGGAPSYGTAGGGGGGAGGAAGGGGGSRRPF